MSGETIEPEVRQFATQANVIVWEGIPWGGATTLSPDSLSLDRFLEIARAVQAPILYLDSDGSAAAFARSGVIHVFATPAERARLTGDAGDDEDAFLDEEDDSASVGLAI